MENLDRKVMSDIEFFILRKFIKQRCKIQNLKLYNYFVKYPTIFSNHNFYHTFDNSTVYQFSSMELFLTEKKLRI